MPNSGKHLVFVYGTLKRNEPNHHYMKNATFIADARTTEKFPLVIASRYNIPFLLNVPGQGKFIMGEMYSVDDETLAELDKLEEYPRLYDRVKQTMEFCATGELQDCWIYVLKMHKPEMLNLPFYENYSAEGDHGLKYVARYQRKTSFHPDVLSESGLFKP